MTGRILRTELRRSAAGAAGLVLLLVCLAFVYSTPGRGPFWRDATAWTAQWGSLAVWSRFMFLLGWPAVVGVGAVAGLRDRRSGIGELLGTTARPAWQRIAAPVGALALAAVTGYAALLSVGGVQVAAHDGLPRPWWVPVAFVGSAALVAGGWLGFGIARAVPSVLTPPLLAGGALAGTIGLFLSTPVGDGSTPEGNVGAPVRLLLLSPVLSGPAHPWQTVAGRVSLGQAAWWLGLAGAGLLLATAAHRRARVAAVPAALAGLAAALVLLPGTAGAVHGVDRAAAALSCVDGLCLTRLHEPMRRTLRAPAERALAALRVVPGAPARIEEVPAAEPRSGPPPRRADAILFNADWAQYAGRDGDQLASAFVLGAGTPSCFGAHDAPDEGTTRRQDRELVARHVVAARLLGDPVPLQKASSAYGPEVGATAREAWLALDALDAPARTARYAAVRDAGLTCRADPLAALTGLAS
ncbi:hypothetical protein Val02_20010 [Virgisporangium aliadipatigenens]|uniref:Uncharacterized protein n=1 Tax=Virgisporangium aliadipatigenens TaxID=741659 RepID=A0A8J4DNP7_9ACTN|nr:hypothetical protein Val02_20010 [Virgisporangium aliadipatigenens]